MMQHAIALVVVINVALCSNALAQPQRQAPAKPQAPSESASASHNIPIRVQVAISSYQGEKRISSVPYTLSVTAVAQPFPPKLSQLRMGAKVPLPATKPVTVDGKPISAALPGIPTGGGPVSYQEIGTNIDCLATFSKDGRFELQITIEDESLANDRTLAGVSKAEEPPIIRSFRASNRVTLRDGQSTQFTAATDRISGETIRVDVTLTVAK